MKSRTLKAWSKSGMTIKYKLQIRPLTLGAFIPVLVYDPRTQRYKRIRLKRGRWHLVRKRAGDGRLVFTPEDGARVLLSLHEANEAGGRMKRLGFEYRVVPVEVEPYPNLAGDLDCDPDLLRRLNRVGAKLKVTVYVRSGRRTLEEQRFLYDTLGPSIAAYPSPSAPHIRGVAADCGINGVNIGRWPGARDAMKGEGLCLRVPGEDWHVEIGETWRA
jgi:hypothetical protein